MSCHGSPAPSDVPEALKTFRPETTRKGRWAPLRITLNRPTALVPLPADFDPTAPCVELTLKVPGGARMVNRPRPSAPVVNISSYVIKWTVLSGLFPIAYVAVVTCVLLQAFRMMRQPSASSAKAQNDRTGLKTVHPELLDQNGEITNEDLWAVRFSHEQGVVLPEC